MSDIENDTQGKITCYGWHRSAVPDSLFSDPVDSKSLPSALLVVCDIYLQRL